MRQVHFKIRYDCSSCNEKFARIPYLKAHQIEAHPNVIFDNYQCTDCDKRFKSNYSLHVHSRSHFSTGWNTKRPIYGFPCTCDKCGMIITKRKDLTAHMYRHRIKERNDEKIKQQIDLAK